MVTRLLVPATLLAAALSGCTDDGTVTQPSAPATTATSSPPASSPPSPAAPGATSAVPFPANTLPDTGTPEGGPLGLKAARAAAQPGFDRVVFELAGSASGHAGWRVEYVTAPESDGSGDPVQVKGSAFLQVVLTGVGYPMDTGVPEPTARSIRPTTALVQEVRLNGVFEGQYQAFIGLSAKKPFRVFRLSDPERVVVDIRR